MKFNLNLNIRKSLFILGLNLCGNYVYAQCTVTDAVSTSIKIPSISLYESGESTVQFRSGLSCTGFSLATGNMAYLKYSVEQASNNFRHIKTLEPLRVQLTNLDQKPIVQGAEEDLSRYSFMNFFSGADGSIPFYYNIPAGQNVSPGIYIADKSLKIRWFYSIPALAALGFGLYYESPGINRGIPWTGWGFKWGEGIASTQHLQVEILPDCRILTQDVNLGTAAFIGQFEPVQTSMGIRCSVNTAYSVSLNNGLYSQNGNQRAMKSQLTNDYLKYEIYKNSTSERWGQGIESWSSNDATVNGGVYDGRTQQLYSFTTRILSNNLEIMPAGNYQDIISVEVSF